MTNRIIVLIAAWTLLYLVFFKLFPYLNDKYHGCYVHEDIYNQKIKAIVTRKFIDSANHCNKTIVYSTGGSPEQMIFPGYLEDMYDYLNPGDSIIKKQASIYYSVRSNVLQHDTLFKFYTTCKDSLK